MNRILSIIVLSGTGLAILTALLDGSLSVDLADALYAISGLAVMVAGSWLSIRNLKK